jgi:hypothetical protein
MAGSSAAVVVAAPDPEISRLFGIGARNKSAGLQKQQNASLGEKSMCDRLKCDLVTYYHWLVLARLITSVRIAL